MDVHSQSRSEHVLDVARVTVGSSTDGPATRRSPGGGHRLQQRPRRSDRPSPQRRGHRSSFTGARRSGTVVESIRAEGGEAMAALANLADATECTAFVSAAQEGPVDILINNAGAFANRSWEDASPEDWLELYAINVAAVVRCVQGFLPVMRQWVGSDHPDRHGRGDQPVPHDARLRRHEGGAAEPHRVTVEVPDAQRHHRQHRQPWHRRDAGRRAVLPARGVAARLGRGPRPSKPVCWPRSSTTRSAGSAGRRRSPTSSPSWPARSRLRQRRQPAHRRWQHRRHMTVGYDSMPWTSGEAPLIIER